LQSHAGTRGLVPRNDSQGGLVLLNDNGDGACVDGIEVEAVIGGVLQRVRLSGVAPMDVKALLQGWDPACKVREDFPSKFMGGKKETKTARVLVINMRCSDSGKFIDLTAQNGDDISIAVPKRLSETFVSDLKALDKLGDKQLAKLEKAVREKTSATLILREEEQIGAKYWTSDDGKAFLDSLAVDAPALVADVEEVDHE